MYSQDSFFDLTPWGRTGLVAISTVLFLLTFFATRLLLRRQPAWLRPPAALLIFYLFVWVSPQVYYQYYRLIIPDLPLQWVIWPPENPRVALEYLFFQGPQNLSAHAQGLLGWSLLAAPFARFRRSRDGTASR